MATNVYKVHYHAELNGKLYGPFGNRQEYVSAANGDPGTLQAVLSGNGKDVPSWLVIKFDAIQNVGIGPLT